MGQTAPHDINQKSSNSSNCTLSAANGCVRGNINISERRESSSPCHPHRGLFSSSGRASVANDNPVASIMDQYAGTGPYSLLHRLHNEKRRANVMIRRVNRYECIFV